MPDTSPTLPPDARKALDRAFWTASHAQADLAHASETAWGRLGRHGLAASTEHRDDAAAALAQAVADALSTLGKDVAEAVSEYAQARGWTPADTACALLDEPGFLPLVVAWYEEDAS